MHLQLPPIFLDHDHNLLHHLYKRGERVKGREGRREEGVRGQGEGEGEGGGGCEGTREMTHLCMSTRVYRKPWWWRKMGVLFQRHRFVEMVLREGRREGGRERGKEGGERMRGS